MSHPCCAGAVQATHTRARARATLKGAATTVVTVLL